MKKIRNWWMAYWYRPESLLNLALYRWILCGYTLFQINDFVRRSSLNGGNLIWDPTGLAMGLGLLPFEINERLQTALLVGLVLATIGLFTNFSLIIAVAAYFVLLAQRDNSGRFFEGHNVVLVVLFVMAFSRCGQRLSLDALINKWRGRSLPPLNLKTSQIGWPVQLMRSVVILNLFGAGFCKLATSGWDWIISDNLRNFILGDRILRMNSFGQNFWDGLGIWITQVPYLPRVLAGMGVFFELSFILAPFFPRWLWAWGLGAIFFHVVNGMVMGVYFFHFIALYFLFFNLHSFIISLYALPRHVLKN